MRVFATFCLTLLLLASARFAFAITPESGWWWNPQESGRGFSIEVQDRTIFMAGFLYTEQGAPFWFTAAGSYNDSADTFQADMTQFRSGQCIGCSYRAPQQGANLGRVEIRFRSPTQATLTWPGGTIAIERQIYGTRAGAEKLLGSFAFSTAGSSGSLHNGQWLNFVRSRPDASLGTVVEGFTESNRVVVATLTRDGGSVLVLVDSSTGFYQLYQIPLSYLGTRDGLGLWTIYAKTATTVPTPTALAHFGRILPSVAAAAKVRQLSAPSAEKLALQQRLLALEALDAGKSKPADGALLADVQALQVHLQKSSIQSAE
jgi:hypothetical protein